MQLKYNSGQKPKLKSAKDLTAEATDIERIFSELELEMQKVHEIVNNPDSVVKRKLKIEGYKKETLARLKESK